MEKLPVAELDFSKLDGLITVVTQASETGEVLMQAYACLLYTSPSPRDAHESRMPSSA